MCLITIWKQCRGFIVSVGLALIINGHWIYCAMEDFAEVSDALEKELGEAKDTKLIWKPQSRTMVDLETAQKLMRLIDTLEDDDDVQTVTANFDIPDDVAAELG